MENVSVSQLKEILKELISESIYDVPDVEDDRATKPYGGWLDPDGKFHPCGYQEHGIYASRVLQQMGVKRDLYNTSYEELYKRKFVRIQLGQNTLYFQYHPVDKKLPQPSPKQMKALRDLAIEYKCTSLWDENTNRQVFDDLLEESTNYVGVKYWWMDSHYKLHPVKFEQHRQWAEDYLKKVGYGFARDVYKAMFLIGFVRLVKQNYNGVYTLSYQYSKERPLNAKQMKHIKDLAIEENCDYIIDDTTGREMALQEGLTKGFRYEPTEWDKRGHEAFWMEPNGTFHNVKTNNTGHFNWAKRYLETKLHKTLGEDDDPSLILKQHGWIRVTFNYYNEGEFTFEYLDGGHLTNSVLRHLRNKAIELQAASLVDGNKNKPLELNEASSRKVFSQDGNRRWWMDTDGQLYDVSKEGHSLWGAKHISAKLGPDHEVTKQLESDYQLPYDILFGAGWIRLVFDVKGQILFYEYHDIPPTSIQKSTLKRLSDKLGALAVYNEKTGKPDLDEKAKLSEDMSYEELMKLTTPERKERAANVNVRSLPVTVENNSEQWNFRYKSSPQTTVTDKPFKGSISFLKGKVGQNNNAMKMKCKVDCECPDFMYRFAYNDAAKGASQIGPDSLNKAINRRPKPAYDEGPGLCKHLVALGKFLKTKIQATKKSNLFEALDDVANQGPFEVTYYD